MASSIQRLHADARAGERTATARLLSLIERAGPDARRIDELTGATEETAFTVGITGAPGAGKSTLTSALVGRLRDDGRRVAILAIDPTSPFTGGAILGDRVRMQDHALDDGVFIRSMATRGQLGGLALAVPQAVRLLDDLGWPLVIIETVGVGQVEVDIAGQADTTVVVVNPGWGDAVQASKAGLLEIADVLVVNKADRDGAQQTHHDLAAMLDLTARPTGAWRPPIVATVATDGTGVAELSAAIDAHQRSLTSSGELARTRSARRLSELRELVAHRFHEQARRVIGEALWADMHADVAAGNLSPGAAADRIVQGFDATT